MSELAPGSLAIVAEDGAGFPGAIVCVIQQLADDEVYVVTIGGAWPAGLRGDVRRDELDCDESKLTRQPDGETRIKQPAAHATR